MFGIDCTRSHLPGKMGDVSVMKTRLQQPSLALPRLTICGEEAFPRDGPDELRAAGPLIVVPGVPLEHVLHVVGVVDQVEHLGTQAKAHYVSIRKCGARQEAEEVRSELRDVPKEPMSRRPGSDQGCAHVG